MPFLLIIARIANHEKVVIKLNFMILLKNVLKFHCKEISFFKLSVNVYLFTEPIEFSILSNINIVPGLI